MQVRPGQTKEKRHYIKLYLERAEQCLWSIDHELNWLSASCGKKSDWPLRLWRLFHAVGILL